MRKEQRCRHRHLRSEHPQCWCGDKLIDDFMWWKQIRTGYLDVETTGFTGDYNYMLSWAIKYTDGEIVYDHITPEDIEKGIFDKRIVKNLLKAMSEFDCFVTYYGTGFDIPFIRTRAFSHGLEFFNYGRIKHIDLYYIVRSKLKLQRKSLEKACAVFNISGKNHVDAKIWIQASIGNKNAISYVLNHNIEDVKILEQLHDRLVTQAKFTKRSI